MSDYTPTTEEVRDGWVRIINEDGSPSMLRISPEDFDRWLAEVKAQAWQEGWDTKPPYQKINNPYRQGEA